VSEQKLHKRLGLLEWLMNKLHITRKPIVKVYHGYGDEDMLLVYGHVFRQSPLPVTKYKKNFLTNTLKLIRMFMVKPYANVRVSMKWGNQVIEDVTDDDGFFKLEWKSETPLQKGWHKVNVEFTDRKNRTYRGEGTVLIPFETQFGFVSDIDDTFLISHSSNLRKRLYVLFTKNARTRRPFEGVAEHYKLLSLANTKAGLPNPFFYVSSSEWNLYEYIKEFCRSYEMPEGVFLLSQVKQWYQFFKTGQGKHSGKFMRIARLLKKFPHRKFILLGDDTQEDPNIYTAIVQAFPGQIICVYLRHVRKSRRNAVEGLVQGMREQGVEVCYFSKSSEAIEHSRKIGLITNKVIHENTEGIYRGSSSVES
jgi:phosphatidate phosphatase APP1